MEILVTDRTFFAEAEVLKKSVSNGLDLRCRRTGLPLYQAFAHFLAILSLSASLDPFSVPLG